MGALLSRLWIIFSALMSILFHVINERVSQMHPLMSRNARNGKNGEKGESGEKLPEDRPEGPAKI